MKKLYRKEKYTTFKNWHANRGIGGSSASALFNENKHQDKLDIYCAMVAPMFEKENIEEHDNESTLRGKALEPIIRNLFAYRFKDKFKVQSPNGFTQYRRIDKEYMTATLDGILTDKTTGERWILEIKTHENGGKADMEEWKNHLPQRYFIQVIHYLAVLNDFKGAIVVADILNTDYDLNEPLRAEKGNSDEIKVYVLEREKFEKEIALVEEVETEFMENNVNARIPPNFKIEF